MDENVYFRSDTIVITPAIARFGPVSYQVPTITSVAVYHRPRLNPAAVTLIVLALGLGLAAYFAYTRLPDYTLWLALAAPVALILGVVWQRIRPVLEYRFVMKTAGHETETLTTFDRAHAFKLKDAVENAFLMQRPSYQPLDTAPFVASPAAEDRSGEGLLITRDWLVANPDLAPR